MTLQILVNHYKETEQMVKQFLTSLKMQAGVQFEVLIASDGGDIHLTNEILSGYPFPIKYAYLPHAGVCHTRNVLFDQATADYVMFCDIDDMFWKPDGLKSLMESAEKTQADVIGSPYQSEIKNEKTNKFEYHVMKEDTLRVHGKIFKRQFLIDNEIRYPDEMEVSGDMMYLWLVYSLTKKIVWIENNFYIWKWNDNSVTRKDGKYFSVLTFGNTLKCYMLLAEDLKRRNRPDIYRNLIPTLFAMIYVEMTHPIWKKAPKDAQQQARAAAINCLSKYFNDYKMIDEEFCKVRYNFMLEYVHGQGLCGKFEDMLSWIERQIFDTNILIVGYGNVGHNLEKELDKLKPDIYDKYKRIDTRQKEKYHIAFICVPTPHNEKSPCDASEVYESILNNNADIYVIKSTVLPGITDKLCEKTGKKIIFSPEYYGNTQHCNNYNFDFTTLGGDKESCKEVIQVLQKVYDGRHQFRITDAKTAELVKYMENSYLATKVSFCQQFYNLAEQIGVDYEELRELFILDPRVNPSHTFVYRDKPYWDTVCLNKDVTAIAEVFNAPLLKDIIKFNENQKIRKE